MERSRQSARECRARKRLRYEYLDQLVQDREDAVQKLQSELRLYETWCDQLDRGIVPRELQQVPDQRSDSWQIGGKFSNKNFSETVPENFQQQKNH